MIQYESKFYASMPEALAQIKAAEQLNNTRPPMPWPETDPNAIMAHKMLDDGVRGLGMGTNQFGGNSRHFQQQMRVKRLTYFSEKSHFCAKPLEQLKPITLKQMEVPKIHYGRFLVCRVESSPDMVVGTTCLAMDLDGNVEYVTLHNCNANLNDKCWLKKGTILVIKEPHLKFGPYSDFNRSAHTDDDSIEDTVFISVQSPTDVLLVHETEKELLEKVGAMQFYKPEELTSEALKAEGNEMFKKGEYDAALGFYKRSLAANAANESVGNIHLNMAATLLQMNRFYEAYKEAEIALGHENVNREKALFRLGKAAYGMRDWANSGEWLKQLVEEFPTGIATKEAVEFIAKVKARQHEVATGQYNMLAMVEMLKGKQKNMDAADFVGPVKVAEIPGKGKGLIATKDVTKGSLIAATKAYTFCEDNISDYGILEGYIPTTKEYLNSSQVRCVMETIQKLKHNPQTAKQVYGIYAGPDMDRGENIPEGLIDAGRIEKICASNVFACNDILDYARDLFRKIRDYQSTANTRPMGLWLLPSFANHSCLANATFVFYGDMHFLYATKDVKAGEEITVQYIHIMANLSRSEREEALWKKWQFQCMCPLCASDRLHPNEAKKRDAIMEWIDNICLPELRGDDANSLSFWLVMLLGKVKALRETYGGDDRRNEPQLQPLVGRVLQLVAQICIKLGFGEKAIEALEEMAAIETATNVSALKTYAMLVDVHIRLFRPKNVQAAKRIAERAYQDAKITHGVTDKKMFGRVFPDFPSF